MNRLGRSQAKHVAAWDYLRNVLHADLVLAQEAVPPTEFTNAVYRPIDPEKYNWGSAVVSLRADIRLRPRPRVALDKCYLVPVREDELPDSHPGACAVADVLNAQGARLFTAISLYGQWEMTPGGKNMFAGARVHRMLSDLTGVLAPARHCVVLAGDLNVTTQGAKSPENEAAAVFARLRAWRMVDCISQTRHSRPRLTSCTCPDGELCSHVQTFRKSKSADGATQLDYAFTSESVTVTGCKVDGSEEAWSLSDHSPIVIDVDEQALTQRRPSVG